MPMMQSSSVKRSEERKHSRLHALITNNKSDYEYKKQDIQVSCFLCYHKTA